MHKGRFFVLLAVLLLAAGSAMAQVQTGRITGTVFDQQGNVVPDAAVTVRDQQTQAAYRTKTNQQGSFVVPGLPFGTYSVTVEMGGFRTWQSTDVNVVTAQDSIVKATLEVGQVTEVVTVESSQAVINTTTAELQTDIDRKQLLDLPLVTRNPMDLVGLQVGVTTQSNTRNAVFNGLRGRTNNITQDGINVQDNFVRTGGFFAISAPTVENTGEFSISSGTLSANSGAGVGQVRLSTPRGSGEYHGSLFYFHRNDALNANTFFNNLTGAPKEREREHRFGGRVGGPVWFPKIYDGRERSFFFFRYEGFRENFSATRNRTVLTDTARQGMFTYTDTGGAQQTVNLFDPTLFGGGATPLPMNALTTALINAIPLPNNTLLGDGPNTAGFRFNVPGTDSDNRYTVRLDHKLIESEGWGTHWIEWSYNWAEFSLSPDSFNGLEAPFPSNVALQCIEAMCINASQKSDRGVMAAAVHSTFGASVFNEFRAGFNRAPVGFLRDAAFPRAFRLDFASVPAASNPELNFLSQGRITPTYNIIDNFSWVKGDHNFAWGFLYTSTSGISFNDAGTVPQINLGDNASNSAGLDSNNFPGGIGNTDFARAENIYADLVGLLGSVDQTFNADPDSGFVPGLGNETFVRERAYNFYFNDSWRLFPSLTFNYGLRWEIVPAPDAVNRRALLPVGFNESIFFGGGSLFQPNPAITFADILSGTVAPTQLDLAGASNGQPFWDTDWNNFAPSIGIAWQFMDKTVLRTGFSASYTRDGLTVITQPLGSNDGVVFGGGISDPTGTLNPMAPPTITPPTFQLPVSQLDNWVNSGVNSGIFTFDPNLRTPYVLQWSFGIERELSPSMGLSLFYVGNHAVKLYRGVDFGQIDIRGNGLLNEFQAAQTNLACNRANGAGSRFDNRGFACNVTTPILSAMNFSFFTSSTFVNPIDRNEVGEWAHQLHRFSTFFFFDSGGSSFAGLGNFPANFFRSNPFTFFADAIGNHSSSRYDGLQVEFRRRLSRGWLLQTNYTFGKVLTDSSGGAQNTFDPLLDLQQPRFDRTRADFDIRHTFNMTSLWEIPVGTGRRFLAGIPVLSKVLEGWQVGGIWRWRSGEPITILSGRGTLNRAARSTAKNSAVPLNISPNQVCDLVKVRRTTQGVLFLPEQFVVRSTGTQTSGANLSEFANPGPGEIGPQGLVNGCSGAPSFRVDMNLVKRTSITERLNFEFRAEFFNILNNVNFNIPNTNNINNPGFGTITALSGGDGGADARQIQFNFRINF
ncbi:MAG: carboxypeptidase-like regulatory domain-containing protein [Verrucomicrobiales bacterium]|nr:carboxypeptidase-like regulatory domain-containing protein [Verrucomicrobiales bacterium]